MAIRYLSGVNIDSNTLFVDDVNNRVGVGTGSPAYTLDIATSSSPTVRITRNGATDLRLGASIIGAGALIGTYSNSPMSFLTNSVVQAVITEAGNFGIGTTSPSYKASIVAANGNYWNGTAFTGTPLALSIENSQAGGYDSVLIYNQADSGGTLKNSGAIGMVGTGPWTAGNNASQVSDMYFLVRNSSGSISERLRIKSTGAAQLKAYGSGSFTGTVAYNLAVDSSGNIIETAGGVVDGSGTANYVSKWSDANTLTDSIIYDNGTNVGIGTTVPYAGTGVKSITVNASSYPTFALKVGDTFVGGVFGYSDHVDLYAENYLNFETGGSEKMRITAAGNVGIGTTSPGGRLHIATPDPATNFVAIDFRNPTYGIYGKSNSISGRGNTLEFTATDYNTNGSVVTREVLTLRPEGNVGIGTTSPNITGQAGSGTLTVKNSSTYGVLEIAGSSSVQGGVLSFFGDTTRFAQLTGEYASATNGMMIFRTLVSGTLTENIRITGGNVGIGTTSPAYKLDVTGTARVTSTLLGGGRISAATEYRLNDNSYSRVAIIDGSGAFAGGYNFNINSGTPQHDSTGAVSAYYYNSAGYISFYTNSSQSAGTAASERMRITAAGNVGIGTTSPGAKLDVYRGLQTDTITRANAAAYIWGADIGLAIGQYSSGPYGTWLQSLKYDNNNSFPLSLNPSGGNVGIGTASPAYKLDVNGNARAGGMTLNAFASGTSGGNLELGFDGTQGVVQAYNRTTPDFIPLYLSGSDFRFNPNGTERVRITSAGNVGIGTTAPVVKTQIVGPTLTTTSETTYPLWLSDTGDTTKALILGFDLANDVGVIQAVDQAVAWKDVCIAPTGAAVGIGNVAPSQKLHVSGNVRVTGAYYDSSNSAGSSGQVLSSTGSGTAWVNQGEATATSLYDLLPAARVAFNWTGQVVNDTWTTVFSKSSNLLTTGTWMVRMYVSDFATGGGHYTYTYSGMFTWYQDTTNQGGEQAASEIYLHRMGHAANASVLYLRTTETAAASSGDGLFQIKGNYSNTSNQTIQFQFVKIF